MKNAELKKLLSPFNISLDQLKYDYSDLKTTEETEETCPTCGEENEIKSDGTSDCSSCGHKEILPCSICPLNDMFVCDWNLDTRCSVFPK